MTSGSGRLSGDNVFCDRAWGFGLLIMGMAGLADCGLHIFLAVTACACDHRNRRTEHRRGAEDFFFYLYRLLRDAVGDHAIPLALAAVILRDHLRGPSRADVLYRDALGGFVIYFVPLFFPVSSCAGWLQGDLDRR